MDENKDNSQNWLTIQIALRHYSNKMIVLTDENVKKGNDVIRNDIFEHLTNVQNIILQMSSLDDLSLEQGLVKERKIITTYKNY